MRILSIAAASLFTSLVGCSSTGNVPATTSPFEGSWTCSESSSLDYTSPPASEPVSTTVAAALIITPTATGLTATASTDAGTTCPVLYTSSGSTATPTSNQICKAAGLTFTYTQGTATVSGGALTISLSFSFVGELADSGTAVAGTGTTTYSCSKT